MAYGASVFRRPGDRKGELTEKILELNRSSLFEWRTDRLTSLRNFADKWATEQNPVIKEILENEFKIEAEPDKKYSFIVKGYLLAIDIAI